MLNYSGPLMMKDGIDYLIQTDVVSGSNTSYGFSYTPSGDYTPTFITDTSVNPKPAIYPAQFYSPWVLGA
jgi:hypothetical protein